uniref:Cadherin domain-containing protein n=1 Tax=Angiostrongylus cantonensis TaxID=6313 RepID=A0A0K0D2G1_ANGCA
MRLRYAYYGRLHGMRLASATTLEQDHRRGLRFREKGTNGICAGVRTTREGGPSKYPSIQVIAYDCQLACIDPHQSQNATITGVLTVNDVNDNFPRFSEKAYYFTVIQGQASPGSHLGRVSATDFDVETNGLNYSISGAIRAPKQSFPLSNAPISIEAGTGRLTVNEPLREPSYSFTVVVTDGVGHVDSAAVVISVITYSQQTELLFDAPFDFINKNEKNVVKLLSNATSLTAVVDRLRQNANFTSVLAHFLDAHGNFMDVDNALRFVLLG